MCLVCLGGYFVFVMSKDVRCCCCLWWLMLMKCFGSVNGYCGVVVWRVCCEYCCCFGCVVMFFSCLFCCVG